MIEKAPEIPDWLTQRQTALLAKAEDFSNKRNYRPITCLNTGMIGNYIKEHVENKNIWNRSNLGIFFGVLGTVDQLIIDNVIMDKVRNQQRSLAVAFYDYQKAQQMVRNECTNGRGRGVPEKVVNVIIKLN